MAYNRQSETLARRLRNLERQALAAKQPTLGYSSIDDGAITSVDQDGQIQMVIGKQFDGTQAPTVTTGPPPPQPSAPTLQPVLGGVRVHWDGTYVAGEVSPMDWARTTIHATPEGGAFDPLQASQIVGFFASATGGDVGVALEGYDAHDIRLVSWSLAGKFSVESTAVTGSAMQISFPDLAEEAAQELAKIQQALDAANQAGADAASALTAADNAATDAAAAQSTAEAAALDAAAAAGLVGDKAVIRIQGSAPGVDDQNENTLWIDTSAGNVPKRWSAPTWVEVQDAAVARAASDAAAAASAASQAQSAADDAAQAAQEAKDDAVAAANAADAAGALAQSAMDSADGKNSILRATYPPTNEPNSEGDTWWYRDGTTGEILGLYIGLGGTAWQQTEISNEIIGNLDAGKITFGTMEGERIRAGSLVIGQVGGLQDTLDEKATEQAAQAMADAAQAAATSAAASDATSKANSAKDDAVAQAALDAGAEFGETKDLVGNWRVTGETTINGGAIKADTVTASLLLAGDALVEGLLQVQQTVSEAVATNGLYVGPNIAITTEGGITIDTIEGQTVFPADGSAIQLMAEVTAQKLTVLGDLEIQGISNKISKSSSLRLEEGVSPPGSGPVISPEYDYRGGHAGFYQKGLVWHGGIDRYLKTESAMSGIITEIYYNNTTGEYTHGLNSYAITDDRPEVNSAAGGLCVAGDDIFVLCHTTEQWSSSQPYRGRWYVYHYTLSGTNNPRWSFVRRWRYLAPADTNILSGMSDYNPAIAYDPIEGDIVIAQAAQTGVNYITRFTLTGSWRGNPTKLLTPTGTDHSTKRDIGQIIFTEADTGDYQKMWLVYDNSNTIHCWNPGTGRRETTHEFPSPATPLRGLYWDGIRFKAMTDKQVIHFSQIKDTNLATSKLRAVQTWRRRNATAPAYAAAETEMSTVSTSQNFPKRAWLRIQSQGPIPNDPGDPSDADSLSFYVARTVGAPVRTDFTLAAAPAVGVATVVLDTLPTSGGNPPAPGSAVSKAFGDGAPAQIISVATDSSPKIHLKGDGSGRLGTFHWGSEGNYGSLKGFIDVTDAALVGTLSTMGDLAVGGSEFTIGQVRITQNYLTSSSGDLIIRSAGNNIGFRTAGSGSNAMLIGASNNVTMAGDLTLSGSASVGGTLDISNVPSGSGPTITYNSNNGRLRQTGSSSRRFKENIRPLALDPERFLDVVPYIYDRNDMEPEDDPREVGFIAEEVDALGLTDLVFYDGDGDVHGVDYLRWCVGLQSVVRHLRDRINELEK